MNFIQAFFERLRCEHTWIFQRRIHEQSLRAGFKHDSLIYKCSTCGKIKTLEQPVDD